MLKIILGCLIGVSPFGFALLLPRKKVFKLFIPLFDRISCWMRGKVGKRLENMVEETGSDISMCWEIGSRLNDLKRLKTIEEDLIKKLRLGLTIANVPAIERKVEEKKAKKEANKGKGLIKRLLTK